MKEEVKTGSGQREITHTALAMVKLQSGANYKRARMCVSVCTWPCVYAGRDVEKRLAELESQCKQKEEERVELELRLTEVKENLKKSLARGSLGPPNDTKISVKVGCFSKATSVLQLTQNLFFVNHRKLRCVNY